MSKKKKNLKLSQGITILKTEPDGKILIEIIENLQNKLKKMPFQCWSLSKFHNSNGGQLKCDNGKNEIELQYSLGKINYPKEREYIYIENDKAMLPTEYTELIQSRMGIDYELR